jgi:hypothetical protein
MQDPEQYYDPPGGLLSFDIKEGQRKSGEGNHLLLLDLAKPKSPEGPEVDLAALEASMAQVRTKHLLDSIFTFFGLMLGD